MVLKSNFYEQIYEQENIWLEMIDNNLLNVYYLTELKRFYTERQLSLSCEYELTLDHITEIILFLLSNIIEKIDYIIDEDKNGNFVDLSQLKNYFLISQLSRTNVEYISKIAKTVKTSKRERNIYDLRNKVIDETLEDYLDDDFYYSEKKVI